MLVIRNIGQLVLPVRQSGPTPNTCKLQTLANASVCLDGDKIVSYGRNDECETSTPVEELDAGGGCVVPGLVDCHTHTLFAGLRQREFVQRLAGKSYTEIAEQGGGIHQTVQAVRAASVDELVDLALPRLRRMLTRGVTTVEIKSGYGLNVQDEIKMLQAVKRLGQLQPVELVATFLGAHTVPVEYAHKRSSYVDLIISDELMGRVADEGLAEFCDVFCERTAFSVKESRRVLLAGKERDLAPKVHADQMSQMGASRLAAEVGALSADHLEKIDDGGLAALREAGVIGVLLPGCAFFLGVEQAPGRCIIRSGLPVALATDYNPGSSMIESLPLVMSIACTQMGMTPAEALIATTVNAAAAIGRNRLLGSIQEGMQADLVILEVPDFEQWPYHVGQDCVGTVIKKGQVVYQREAAVRS